MFLQTVCAFSSSMRMLSVAHPMKSALLRIGVHSLVSILWWHLFFEWGHSMDDDTWAKIPSGHPEFKVNVSEWVLHSTSASYLLNDRDYDYDSHTPLLIEVHANHFSRSRAKEMNRNPDTLKEAADRRKRRQKMNKARGSQFRQHLHDLTGPDEINDAMLRAWRAVAPSSTAVPRTDSSSFSDVENPETPSVQPARPGYLGRSIS